MTASSLGVLIVGLGGATANTYVAGTIAGTLEERAFGSVIAGGLDASLFADDGLAAFGGWDTSDVSAYDAAVRHAILPREAVERASDRLRGIVPLLAYVTHEDTEEALAAPHQKRVANASEAMRMIVGDIEAFRDDHELENVVVVLLGPPLKMPLASLRASSAQELLAQTPGPPSAVVYALAALEAGCGLIDFTPNVTLAVPAVVHAAETRRLPLAGRDGNTGQTLMKTVLGQMLRLRNLRLRGWYSTNILGNTDGLVLSRAEHRQLKMQDKLGVLEPILGYDDFSHVVDISYYPPRGDNKEAWDAIDFAGWFGLEMTMKINWLGRDSVLAAPLVSDLVRHVQFAMSRGLNGYLPHLALYFKAPLGVDILPLSDAYELLVDFYEHADDGGE